MKSENWQLIRRQNSFVLFNQARFGVSVIIRYQCGYPYNCSYPQKDLAAEVKSREIQGRPVFSVERNYPASPAAARQARIFLS